MIQLKWVPQQQAYSVRRNSRVIGMVRFRRRLPFREVIELV
jgi:predicted acetyltransferase